MDSPTIRKTFLDFFAERGHTVVPSYPLVPDDPTLLFTTAGMVQFKPYYLREKEPPYPRVASVQKCFRTTDLEIVGTNSRNLTFFEMLGNFSFGDYFKSEACRYGWDLLTGPFGLDPERLWITVYHTDDEAAEIWEKEVGVPPERILRRGREAGNFWDMGVAGPCGPCSELLYDRGPDFGREYTSEEELDEERYLEVWNLVFMQHLQDDSGEIVGDLPTKNIDTGLGLERLAAVLQDVPTTFEIDTMGRIMRKVEEVSGLTYGSDAVVDVSLRVMTEHARGMTFLIGDGVLPSNEFRGYVLRRLIRRAVRYARKVQVNEPFLVGVANLVIELYAQDYPELSRNAELIRRVVEREESRFESTLRQGMGMLEDEIASAKSADGERLSGEVAFRLHDTYGFPLDLTREVASEEGLTVDEVEFEEHMRRQRERARAARTVEGPATEAPAALSMVAGSRGPTEFLGYESLSADGEIAALVSDGEEVQALTEGAGGLIVLDRTTFYAESGGQIGDVGSIRTPTGVFRVDSTRYGVPGLIVHSGIVVSGEILSRQEAMTEVDRAHREGVRQSHTATHMLHWALREFLGEHARQQGSLVEPGRLRFDFSHFEAVGEDQIAEMEEEMNRRVVGDESVRAFETTYEEAMQLRALALFGEKYGDYVRVVEVGDYSRELCGGTHVAHTGMVGVIKILSEGSVAAGTRRVEAYTGMAGLAYLVEQERRLRQAAETLKVEPESVVERLEELQRRLRALDAEISRRRESELREEIGSILASDKVAGVGGSKLVVERRDGSSVDELRALARSLVGGIGSGVVVLGSAHDGKANIVVAGSKDLVDRGISAAELIKEGAGELGGGGGGRPELAFAGGANASAIDSALRRVEGAARSALEDRR